MPKLYLSFVTYWLINLVFYYYCVLQRWSYWREHLKYVWNIYCDVTNHRRDHHTTETTGNERFPICHGTNYFHFVLTFSLFTSKQLLFLPICLQYALYCSDFEINYKADVPGLRTRRFGARVFKLFVTIEIGSYAWSQVTMLQGKPLEFSDFHRYAANTVSVNTFLLGEGDLLFW